MLGNTLAGCSVYGSLNSLQGYVGAKSYREIRSRQCDLPGCLLVALQLCLSVVFTCAVLGLTWAPPDISSPSWWELLPAHLTACCKLYMLQLSRADKQTMKQLHVLPGTAEVEQKGSKLKQHVVVKSRVKEQLQQAQSLHQQRARARQQRLQAALGPRYASVPFWQSAKVGQPHS